MEVSGSTFKKIINRSFNLDFNSHVIREYVDVIRCYKCQKYGHKSGSCSSQVACGKYGLNHDFKGCQAKEVHCINCKAHNDRTGGNVTVSHICGTYNCYVQEEMIQRQKEKIDYNYIFNHD